MTPQLTKFLLRPLSYSSLSSWEWDKEQWYSSYILGIRSTSKQMTFGSIIDQKIQSDPLFMPNLPRYEHMQYKMTGIFSGIPLVCIADGVNLTKSYDVADYKTGVKPWTSKRAKDTKQLDMALLLLYINKKISPEKVALCIHWLPTTEDAEDTMKLISETEFVTIKTKRTMQDILNFGVYLKKTREKMIKYIENHE